VGIVTVGSVYPHQVRLVTTGAPSLREHRPGGQKAAPCGDALSGMLRVVASEYPSLEWSVGEAAAAAPLLAEHVSQGGG
jgi:hypothetical protein